MRFVETAAWLAATVSVLLVQSFEIRPSPELLQALSILPLAFGIRVFIGHGGGRITVLGIFNLSLAMFIGYSGIVEATAPSLPVSIGYLTVVVAGSFMAQVAITYLAWPGAAPPDHPAPAINDHDARWLMSLGAIGFIGTIVMFPNASPFPDVSPTGYVVLFLEGASFASVIVLSMGIYFREGARLVSIGSVIVAAAFFAHVEVIHSGSGRLRLVALACTVALLVSARFPRRMLKWGVVAGTPLAMFWLAQRRLSLQESLATGASAGNTGLESMTGTIVTFAQLLEKQSTGEVPLAWGLNFLSAPLLLVPESVLPFERPNALGYELVRLVDPTLGSGYSLAATVFGEWAFNFGIAGLVLVVPAMAWFLALLERRFRSSVDGMDRSALSFMPVLFWVLIAGSIADLAWNGLHILTARTLSRLPLILAVGLVIRRQHVRAAWRGRDPASRERNRRAEPRALQRSES